MADEDSGLQETMEELARGVSALLKQQEELAARLEAVENRLAQDDGPAPDRDDAYDYRVLFHARTYDIEDAAGENTHMESVRRCVALGGLSRVRTRYHTGSGAREAAYSYRLAGEGEDAEAAWTPLEHRVEKDAGADYAVSLALPEPIPGGAVFELRHRLHLRGAFTTRNEWVTLVVEYPTEAFRLEVLLPAGRKILGARREESQGASNSFNKRRVHPRVLPATGRTRLAWEEERPVTGRAYTLFWDW